MLEPRNLILAIAPSHLSFGSDRRLILPARSPLPTSILGAIAV
ncbi:MAG: hypothetical protein AAGD25_17460 [Cyanobacteria bacterium P01_F01_bin.150]